MEARQLRHFVAIADCGTFTAAAQRPQIRECAAGRDPRPREAATAASGTPAVAAGLTCWRRAHRP